MVIRLIVILRTTERTSNKFHDKKYVIVHQLQTISLSTGLGRGGIRIRKDTGGLPAMVLFLFLQGGSGCSLGAWEMADEVGLGDLDVGGLSNL